MASEMGLEAEAAGVGEDAVLGERIRGLRKRRKMTLAQLAESANLSTGYISQIERKLAYPSIPALVNIAKASASPCNGFSPALRPCRRKSTVMSCARATG